MRTIGLLVVVAVLSACEGVPVELEAGMVEPGESDAVKPAPRPVQGAYSVDVVESTGCDESPLPVYVVAGQRAEAMVTMAMPSGELVEFAGWWTESTVQGWYLETWEQDGWFNEPGTVLRPSGSGWAGTWTIDRYEPGVAPCVMSVVLSR
jgi:hypothetical protein